MPTFRRLALIALFGGVLAACAGSGAVRPPTIGSYRPAMLSYQAGQGAMKTEIFGNPFNAPKSDLDNAVTGAMSGSIFGRPVSFATAVSPQNRSPYRVVMVVNPAQGFATNRLCREVNYPTTGSQPILRMEAAFCANDKVLTATGGTVSGVQSANDPAFRSLVRHIALALFPIDDPTRGDDEPSDSNFF